VVGGLVIGSIDHLARPWLARRGELALPAWVVLVSMFGGIAIIGGWGIVLGPLFVRFAKEALELSREAHDPATHSPATEDPEPESVVSAQSP
jgi:predicted PurR-regulated permease PerM